MIDARQRLHLTPEFLERPGVFGTPLLQDLDDNLAGCHFGIGGQISNSETAAPKLPDKPVSALERILHATVSGPRSIGPKLIFGIYSRGRAWIEVHGNQMSKLAIDRKSTR